MSCPPPNAAIEDLEVVLGTESTQEIVRLFLQEFPESVSRFIKAGREEQLRIVHGLRSSSGLMGSPVLAKRMADFEDTLSDPSRSVSPQDVAVAVSEFEAIAPGLRAYAGQ